MYIMEWNIRAKDIKALFPDKDYHFYNVGCMLPYMDYTPRTLEKIVNSCMGNK